MFDVRCSMFGATDRSLQPTAHRPFKDEGKRRKEEIIPKKAWSVDFNPPRESG
jgi:hypothetical protein